MTLKFQLDNLEGVDESIQALYVEKEGKFVLGIDGLPQQEDVTGLKAKRWLRPSRIRKTRSTS